MVYALKYFFLYIKNICIIRFVTLDHDIMCVDKKFIYENWIILL